MAVNTIDIDAPSKFAPSPRRSAVPPDSLDVLSDVLRTARLCSWGAEESHFTAPWGIEVEPGPAAFYLLMQGQAWLEVEGVPPRELRPGDLAVLMQGSRHTLRDSLHSPTVALRGLLESGEPWRGQRLVLGGGGAPTRLLCGRFLFDQQGLSVLLGALPPLIHVPGVDGKAAPWLAETLRLILCESDRGQPGRQAIVEHLAQVILIHAIRTFVATTPQEPGTWLSALLDADIGPVLGLMHSHPEYPWTVASLADRVCLSRSVFAARFKTLVSKPPLQYLLDCRMQKACRLLTEERRGLKEIAGQVGYATEAAFSNAFKRWSGQAPGAFRRRTLRGDASGPN